MAYMNQEKKARIATLVKPILAKYGIKGSLSVRNHMVLVLTIKSGKIDFIQNYISTVGLNANTDYAYKHRYVDVNPYHYEKHFSGVAKQFLDEVMPALNAGNHNNSDIMTDYFDVGWYVDVSIGKYDKPYEVTA